MKRRLRTLGLCLLTALGVSHVAGSLLQPWLPAPARLLSQLGQASLASPHPRVFCQVGEYEPFRFAFDLELHEEAGSTRRLRLDADRYSRIDGPYMYRNVYGAVLAFSPFIAPEVRDAILRFGLQDGDLLGPLGCTSPPQRVVISTRAHGGSSPPTLEVDNDG